MLHPTSEGNVSANRIRQELVRICESAVFRKSAAASKLLTYVVEQDLAGRSKDMKEYTVAVELFSASADYDPRIDSLVRVNANRLRLRLEEYYASSPPTDLRIQLEKGAYTPSYQWLGQGNATNSSDTQIDDIPAAEDAIPEPAALPRTRRLVSRFLPVGGAFVAVALGCILIIFFTGRRHQPFHDATPLGHVEAFVSSANLEEFAEFSPDGKTVAFVAKPHNEAGRAIYVQAVDSDTPRRLTDPGEDSARPAWSPDETKVAYLRLQQDDSKQVVIRTLATGADAVVASLHGGPLWLCSISHLSWAPDGKTLYTSASESARRPCGIVSIDLASGQVRPVIPPPSGIFGDLEPAVAPDGRRLAFMRNYGASRSDVFVADLVKGGLRQITHETADILGLTWGALGKSLIVSSNRLDGKRRLWRLPLESGSAEALTDSQSEPSFPSIGLPQARIIFTEFRRVSGIWRADRNGSRNVVDNGSSNMGPDISLKGRLLFTSERSGSRALWISDNDGQNEHRVVRENSGGGRWSADGGWIAFECQQQGNQICLSNDEGRTFQTITEGSANHTSPAWSHDGTQVYFTSDVSGVKEIYRKDLKSGVTEGLTNGGADMGEPSQNGRWLYFRHPSSLTGIDVIALSNDRKSVDGGAIPDERLAALAKYKIFYWQANTGHILFVEPARSGGAPVLTLFQPADGSFRSLFPLPSYDGADLPGFSFSDREQAAYYAQSEYLVELKMLEPAGSKRAHE